MVGTIKFPTAHTIRTNKIGVTELTNCSSTIFLSPGPEVAPSKAAEYGCAPGLRTFSLQSSKEFFNGIHENEYLS
jgi:hypothetical protein